MLQSSQTMAGSTAPEYPALFLIGFMGAGKTSVGRELAKLLGWSFVDLDEQIVAQEERSIPEIFQNDGEVAFRELETRALTQVISNVRQNLRAIIALGGGAFVQPINETTIRKTGFPVVFLDADLDQLRYRCSQNSGSRPLFQDDERFRSLYNSRREHYLRANIRIDTTSKTIDAVAQEIINALNISIRG